MDCDNIYFDPTFTILTIHYPREIIVSERPEEYELGHGYDSRFFESFSVFWGCLKGGSQFTADVFKGLLAMIPAAVTSLTSSLKNQRNKREFSDHLRGANSYAIAEFEKSKTEENHSVPRQSLELWNIAVDTIQNKYKSLPAYLLKEEINYFARWLLKLLQIKQQEVSLEKS